MLFFIHHLILSCLKIMGTPVRDSLVITGITNNTEHITSVDRYTLQIIPL